MVKNWKTYLAWLVGLIALQVIILNNLNAGRLLFPYAYLFFILLLPKNTPHWLLLVTGFFLGSIIDVYTLTYGTHAFATTLIAFIRPYLLNSIVPSDASSDQAVVNVNYLGMQKFITYAGLLLLIHHFTVFLIDEFKVDSIFQFLVQVLFSAAVSLFVIVCAQFIFSNKNG